MKKIFLSALCALTLGFMASCNDECEEIVNNNEKTENYYSDAFLINEGSMGLNNASVSVYSGKAGETFIPFGTETIGDVANDALKIDDKLYVAVSSSKTLAIINVQDLTATTTKQVSLNNQPRYMVEKDGYLYISCYGGVIVKFNLSTETVESTLTLEDGKNLEGVAILGNTLYVCNSYYVDEQGGYNYLDQLLTVNLTSFTQGESITTVLNPNYLAVVNNRLFVLGFGDYYLNPYQLAEMDLTNNEVKNIAEATKMCVWGNKILFADSQTDWSQWPNISTNTTFGAYDTDTNELKANVFNALPQTVTKESIYFLQANPKTKEVYMGVTDYVNTSTIHLFDAQGHHINSFDSKGVNTNKAVF